MNVVAIAVDLGDQANPESHDSRDRLEQGSELKKLKPLFYNRDQPLGLQSWSHDADRRNKYFEDVDWSR